MKVRAMPHRHRAERCSDWASRTQKHGEACRGGGGGDLHAEAEWGQQKQSNDPRSNQHNPQYANYWAPVTRKRHIPPHPAQPQHTNDWAPRTRKRHQQEHRPQRPTESSDPTQHAKGRTGDRPGPRKGATTRRNVTKGGPPGVCLTFDSSPLPPPRHFLGKRSLEFSTDFRGGIRPGAGRCSLAFPAPAPCEGPVTLSALVLSPPPPFGSRETRPCAPRLVLPRHRRYIYGGFGDISKPLDLVSFNTGTSEWSARSVFTSGG